MYWENEEKISNDFDITICVLLLTVVITEVLFGVHKADAVSLALLYVFGVLLISYFTSGYHFGIAAALVLSFLYYYYDPSELITHGSEDTTSLGIMLLISIISSVGISRMRSKAEISAQKAKRSELIYEINQQLLTAGSLERIVECALSYARQQIGYSVVFYIDDPLYLSSGIFSEAGSKLDTEEQRKAAHKHFIDPQAGATDTENSSEFFYYPIKTDSGTVILLGVFFEFSTITENDLFFIKNLMLHIGVAADFQAMLADRHRSDIEAEREKVRNTLLSSVSHDLRTPLTGILGESTLIADHVDSLEKEDIKLYANDIKENSQWLIKMVENLLMVTRLTRHAPKIEKIDSDVEEIMAQAVSIVRKRYSRANITVDATANPIYVPMDVTLMTQVLINLLDNAVKYSPEGSQVKLKLEKSMKHICITVADKGEGIPAELHPNIFSDKIYEMKSADSKKGFGLGLTICKTIVKAHGGSIMIGEGEAGRGTMVSVLLPLWEEKHA